VLSGGQLAIAISAVLAGAVALGWVLHWIWLRLSNAAMTDTARLTEMINRLHEADHAREAAEDARELAENLLASREAEMEGRMAAMQAQLDGAIGGREAELHRALREAQAESEAAMTGLGNARRRIMELESEIDELRRELG
jgi:acetylglutamate synthase